MLRKLKFTEEAKNELKWSKAWYKNRSIEVAERFHADFRKSLFEIQQRPEAFPFEIKNIRRNPLSHFPFIIYYVVDDEKIIVISCFHTSRNPDSWQNRNYFEE